MTNLAPALAARLRGVLDSACAEAGVAVVRPELLKYTNNATYRLGGGVIARIGIGELGKQRAPRIVAMARWLDAHDAPTIRLLEDVAQPIERGDCAVTFWDDVGSQQPTDTFSASELAGPVRTMHAIPALGVDDLPRWRPLDAAERRLAAADPSLPAEDLAWLRGQWHEVAHEFSETLAHAATGVVHGDAHTGNLLRRSDTAVVLADLDSSGIGPLSWDLSVIAVDGLRFGRRSFHEAFSRAYGADVTLRREWPLLRRVRELQLVTSAIPDLASRPDIAREHARRIATLRAGNTDAIWQPYR